MFKQIGKIQTIQKRNTMPRFAGLVFLICALFITAGAYGQMAGVEKVPPSIVDAVLMGQSQNVLVLFDDADIQAEAAAMRAAIGADHDTPGILSVKASLYKERKEQVFGALPSGEQAILKDYSHLPMSFLRIDTKAALASLLAQPAVVKVYEDGIKYPLDATSFALINQPQVEAMGITGGGTAVAVLDTGVNYLTTSGAFGTCSGGNTPGDCCPGGNCSAVPPAAPAGCSVACVHVFGGGSTDPHGTNVSGIVVGVAPSTKVVGLNVFSGSSANDSDIIAAINWSIAHQAAYNIVAINLSLGDGSNNSSQCSGDSFASPVSNARLAGILAAIASGNSGFTNGMSSPACVPGAVSVGAVYDASYGSESWCLNASCTLPGEYCTDSTTAADKVTCFSNSASYLTILAPGSFITAAGITETGTSQATPHIAGSIAVLRGTNGFPSDTLDQTVTRMTSTGHPDTDTRSGAGSRVKPRIDLLAAVGGAATTYTISGTITISGGSTPISGATVNLTGSTSTSTTTNSSGFYQFTVDNGSYTVTPTSGSYTFSPLNRPVTVSGANVPNQNFSGTAVPVTYSISGRIMIFSGRQFVPLAGVSVGLSGAGTGTAVTNSSGNFTFTGLSAGGYTLTPVLAGYSFTPVSRPVTITGTNVTGQNFTATVGGATTFIISGTITISGGSTPISGATVNLTGAASASTTTNSSGFYQFTVGNGSYTVTPTSGSYTFSPLNRPVTVSGANVPNQNFSGTAVGGAYSISGNIMKSALGRLTPLSGVTVTLSGAANKTAITDSNGNFTITGLGNGTYTLTPGLAGYSFSPTSRTVTISGASVAGQRFTATSP